MICYLYSSDFARPTKKAVELPTEILHHVVALEFAVHGQVEPDLLMETHALGAFLCEKRLVVVLGPLAFLPLGARRARISDRALLVDGDALGFYPLRRAISNWVGMARGVHCSPEQVVVLPRARNRRSTISPAWLDPGDAVWMEYPGFIGVHAAFNAAGARIVPVSVDDQGHAVAAAERAAPDARLA